jgi:protein tyrosine phosphatase domain-containing protein 1
VAEEDASAMRLKTLFCGFQDNTISGDWGFLVKERVQCICEGGKSCPRENPAKQKGPSAIQGLHSNWVGSNVLAMARPWHENVKKHEVVDQFLKEKIGLIINLQEVSSTSPTRFLCIRYSQ